MSIGEIFWNTNCELEEKLNGCSERTIGKKFENMPEIIKKIYQDAGQELLSQIKNVM